MIQPTSLTNPVSASRPLAAARSTSTAEAALPQDGAEITALPPLETPKDAVETLNTGFGYVEFPQVSPDGKTLIFNVVHDYETSQMFRMKAKGGAVKALFTGEEVTADDVHAFLERHKGRIDEQGSWSVDGKSIFFRTNRQGTFALARFDVKDREDEVLAHDPQLNMKHPVETEDGWLVCYGGPPGEKYPTTDRYTNLFLVNPDGGEVRMLTHSQGEVSYKHPSVLDGQIVAHKENGTPEREASDIVLVDPDTGRETNLTNTPDAIERHPFHNEEVGLLTFHSDETGDKNIWISEPDGSRKCQLTHYGRPAQSPVWSPDGKKIYFVKKDVKQAEGEPFFARQADVRVIDVEDALRDLKKQAKAQIRELEKAGAPAEIVAQAEQRLADIKHFLKKYA
ncbi:MAG: hypothetical protein AB1758_07010 [Candidatus Eremiobacterota bacterium]